MINEPKESKKIKFDIKDGVKATLATALLGICSWAINEYIPKLIVDYKSNKKREIVIDADISPELFEKTENWLNQQETIKCTSFTTKDSESDNNLMIGYCPAVYKFEEKYFIAERSIVEKKNYGRNEKITISVSNVENSDYIKDILKAIKNTKISSSDLVKVSCGWESFYKNKRSFDTIALEKDKKDLIISDFQHFLSNKKYYIDRGLTYKRNYLLYGKAGCGKSSIILALASYFNMNIRLVDISTVNSTNELQGILSRNKNTIIVFEDVDAMNANVSERKIESDDKPEEVKPQSNNISLSSLLNIFDGINTPDGSICIFTTNYIEKLDSAFLRDGRMDFKMEIGDIGKKEIINYMAKNLVDEKSLTILEDKLLENINILPSKCQKILMENNVDDAVIEINKNIKDKLK